MCMGTVVPCSVEIQGIWEINTGNKFLEYQLQMQMHEKEKIGTNTDTYFVVFTAEKKVINFHSVWQETHAFIW